MLREFKLDLHIHSGLSPCGDSRMIPPRIVDRALAVGLDGIAVCDHNSGRNVAAMPKAGKAAGMSVLAGMEISTSEEIHVLALLTGEGLARMQQVIDIHLEGMNNKDFFGPQYVVDEKGYVLSEESRLLSGATTLALSQVLAYIHQFGGVAITSHVDRSCFSLLSQLGFIPPGCPLDALELSAHEAGQQAGQPLNAVDFSQLGYPLVSFSDAHFPEKIGRCYSHFYLEALTPAELRLALLGAEGRELRG